jgi:tetratricopeptide (TPR) repeat protein
MKSHTESNESIDAGQVSPAAAPRGLTGLIQPTAESAVRAVAALRDGRLADAEKHIAAIEELPAVNRAWKHYLRGRLACARGEFDSAETPLRQAAAIALESGLSRQRGADTTAEVVVDAPAARLAAAAFESIGFALRRQDRPAESYRDHWIALHLREEHGSTDEQWESAVSLGLAADFARDAARAEKWYRTALGFGDRATQARTEKLAIAWTHLGGLLTHAGRHEEAVAAARAARDLWRTHDAGSLEAARSDVGLAHALIRWGESLCTTDAAHACEFMGEGLSLLAVADESLAAFGPSAACDSARCGELVDFARRLLSACGA